MSVLREQKRNETSGGSWGCCQDLSDGLQMERSDSVTQEVLTGDSAASLPLTRLSLAASLSDISSLHPLLFILVVFSALYFFSTMRNDFWWVSRLWSFIQMCCSDRLQKKNVFKSIFTASHVLGLRVSLLCVVLNSSEVICLDLNPFSCLNSGKYMNLLRTIAPNKYVVFNS